MTYEERRLSCSKHKHSWALDSCINLNILQTPFIWKSYVQLWNRPFKQPCYQTEHLQVVPTKNIFSSNFSSSSLAEWQSQTFPFCPFGLPWVPDCPRSVCLQRTLEPDIHEESFLHVQTTARMRRSGEEVLYFPLGHNPSIHPLGSKSLFDSFCLFNLSHLPPPMSWQVLPILLALSLSPSWFPLPFIIWIHHELSQGDSTVRTSSHP